MIAGLESALDWLGSKGIRGRPSRYATYLQIIKRIDQRWQEGATRAADIPVDPLLMETAFREALQLIRIAEGLSNQQGARLQEKLTCLVSGPVLERDERLSNSGNLPRNLGFELEVAADFAAAGDIELSEDVDLVVRSGDIPFFIECKRPASLGRVVANLNGAASQIMRRLDATGLTSYGIVALSVAKMHWPAGALIKGASMAHIRASVERWVDGFDRRYVAPWLHRQRDGRMAGVLVHIPYVAYESDSPTVVGTELSLRCRYPKGTLSHNDLAHLLRRVALAT
jgi:hypothetical protein